MYVSVYVCMYVCMHVYMYVCMYVCMYIYIRVVVKNKSWNLLFAKVPFGSIPSRNITQKVV